MATNGQPLLHPPAHGSGPARVGGRHCVAIQRQPRHANALLCTTEVAVA